MNDLRHYFEQELSGLLAARPEFMKGEQSVYQFEIGEGRWVMDLGANPRCIRFGTHEAADCTITTSEEHFQKLRKGELNIVMALLTRKIKVSGDLALAHRLKDLLS